jgi:serine/threonine-protein kinase
MAELTRLGRYQLKRVLGKGAMGVVYEGYDPTLNRHVAVKTILKSIAIDAETAAAHSARFVREAQAVARLNHPHIVQVHDFGEQDEVAYLVMEFIEGRELRAYFDAAERFEVVEAVRIMGELLDALDFAHERGVIHRDVKPANVMLDAQRRAKLADFGVARIQDSDRSLAGTMVGTPAYMSPEQIKGGKVDGRTDIFSAGTILYQLLTGEQPFKGAGAWTVAKQIVEVDPPLPSTLAVAASPSFDAVVRRALAKEPAQRFGKAREFSAALRAASKLAATSAPKDEGARATEAEIEFWRSIQSSRDPDEFRIYLKKFPSGMYAELAQIRLSKIAAHESAEKGVTQRSQAGAELSGLTRQTAALAAQLAAMEAEYAKREKEAEACRQAEEKARAEAETKRIAQERARAEAEARVTKEELEKVKREAEALAAIREAEAKARAEAEYAKREAEDKARKEAEARAEQARQAAEAKAEQARKEAERTRLEAEAKAEAARREATEKARKETEALAKARAEAEARAKKEAEERTKREAEAARREAELTKKLAEAPKAKMPVRIVTGVIAAIMLVGGGAWYYLERSGLERQAELVAALENALRASEELKNAQAGQLEVLRKLEEARAAEYAARKSGDLAKLKDAQEIFRRAEADALRQAELVKQRETAAKKAEETAKLADSKEQSDAYRTSVDRLTAEKKAAEKALADKAAAEKLAAEKAAAEKAVAEKAVAEKPVAEKAAFDKQAAEKKAAEKKAIAATRSGWPSVGDRWVYEARDMHNSDKKYQLVVEVEAITAASIRDATTIDGGERSESVHRAGAFLTGIAPGFISFSPYVRAFQELREGTAWPNVERVRFERCGSFCTVDLKVSGRERVSVRAGNFDAWKIDIRMSVGGLKIDVVYWFADEIKRFVKYRHRGSAFGAIGSQQYLAPDIDMELVSYIPAGAK